MNTYIALLRAVNVGGTGKLPMTELRRLCDAAGFRAVRTYIASGNVVFRSAASPQLARAALERQLEAYAGKPVEVVMRTPAELASVLDENPFPAAAGNCLVILFFNGSPPADVLSAVRHQVDEVLHVGRREIYVHYGDGMSQSKLVIPAAIHSTGRNLNTVRKLLMMSVDAVN
jgi:uncharacterized protein (DUF1697 family)